MKNEVHEIIARGLGFNNDGATPSFTVPREVGKNKIYHAKPYSGKVLGLGVM